MSEEHKEALKKVTRARSANGSKGLMLKLLLATVGMFGFGFALVPLYNVFCDITGLNGKTGGRYEAAAEVRVDTSREVTVQFMARNNVGMNWEFRPEVAQVKVHPGAMMEVSFYARNPSQNDMVAQAVPSVAPSRAADHLRKTECFCFTQQVLTAGEEVHMPLIFFVDQDIPEDVTKLTLSYTLFDITGNFSNTQLSQLSQPTQASEATN